jgi:putative membrane protein
VCDGHVRVGSGALATACDDHRMGIVIRLIISALALWISTLVIDGINVSGSAAEQAGTLLVVAAIFGLVNAVLRPIIKVLGCWAYALTLGLVALVVNGALLMLTSFIADKLDLSFDVDKFWPTAILGALLIGVVSWLMNLVVPDGKKKD